MPYRCSTNYSTDAPHNANQNGSHSKNTKLKAVLGIGAGILGVAVYTVS